MQLSPFLTVFPLFRSPSALRLREPTELLRRGATLGLRIDKYRALIMSRALCAATQQHGAVACTIRRPWRSICSSPCDSKLRLRISFHCPFIYDLSENIRHRINIINAMLWVIFRWRTRKSPLHGNPNLLIVNELTGKGLWQSYSLNRLTA